MTTTRIRPDAGWRGPSKERGPNGRGLCRLCGEEVPKGRSTFCSADHVHQWKLETQPPYVRRLVFKRDRGVCCSCGLDTEALRRRAKAIDRWTTEGRRQYGALMTESGYVDAEGRAIAPQGWWQADHLVPVVEGGGGCGLDGYRTLCLPCHRRETTALARRRAERRRAAKEAAEQTLFRDPS